MKWWDDYAVPVYGSIGLGSVVLFGLIGLVSVFFGVSELSGYYMGFGIIGVMFGCILFGALINKLINLTPYDSVEAGNDESKIFEEDEDLSEPIVLYEEDEDEAFEEEDVEFEPRVNGPIPGSRS